MNANTDPEALKPWGFPRQSRMQEKEPRLHSRPWVRSQLLLLLSCGLFIRALPLRPGTVGWVKALARSTATLAGQKGAGNTHPHTSDPCGLQSHYLRQGQVLWATRAPGSTCLRTLLSAPHRPSASYTLPGHSTSGNFKEKRKSINSNSPNTLILLPVHTA